MPKKFSFFGKITGLKNNDDDKTQKNNKNKINANTNSKNDTHQDFFLKHQHKLKEDDWTDDKYEGQLSVDVYQTSQDIVIKSAVAGVKPENLDISINNDMVTIRGSRKLEEEISGENYFYQECYWGNFSRSIILPIECQADKAEAIFKNGILTIKIPKLDKAKKISVQIIEE